MYSLPTTVVVNDEIYKIRQSGDFRVILDCFSALQDDEISEDARVLASLITFYENFSCIDDLPDDVETLKVLISEMYNFFNCGKNNMGAKSEVSLIDWDGDSQMICAAVNRVAGTEIRSIPYIHWWTFLGYYMSIGESVLSTVVGIRDKIVRGKKLEKWEKDFRSSNPEYFNWRKTSVEEREFDRQLREQFHGGNK